jgi:hypothetical protein
MTDGILGLGIGTMGGGVCRKRPAIDVVVFSI